MLHLHFLHEYCKPPRLWVQSGGGSLRRCAPRNRFKRLLPRDASVSQIPETSARSRSYRQHQLLMSAVAMLSSSVSVPRQRCDENKSSSDSIHARSQDSNPFLAMLFDLGLGFSLTGKLWLAFYDTANSCFFLLTKPLAGPPVWFLGSGELNIRVQPESVVQVRCATLWLTDDIKIWKAAHAVGFSIAVAQVFSKSVPQLLEDLAIALGVARVQVCPVRIWRDIPRVVLVPAGVLDAGQEFARDDGKHLKRQRKQTGLRMCRRVTQTGCEEHKCVSVKIQIK